MCHVGLMGCLCSKTPPGQGFSFLVTLLCLAFIPKIASWGQDGYQLQPAQRWTERNGAKVIHQLSLQGKAQGLTDFCLRSANCSSVREERNCQCYYLNSSLKLMRVKFGAKNHTSRWSERVIFVSVWRFPESDFLCPYLEGRWSHQDASFHYTVRTLLVPGLFYNVAVFWTSYLGVPTPKAGIAPSAQPEATSVNLLVLIKPLDAVPCLWPKLIYSLFI